MNKPNIKYCPCTLQEGFESYSPLGQLELFGSRSKKVSHILPFGPPGFNNELTREYNEKRKRISISGVQEKYSIRLNKNILSLTDTSGSHILKPVPTERLLLVNDLPANEHVSMQMARQIFGIRSAGCGMIFFEDGSPAYITRRFDYKPDGSGKFQVEDFATLIGKTQENEGDNFKYNASYLDIALLIQKYVAAAPVALLNFFKMVVFNYLIANGDAHLKNFSIMETVDGDFLLAPAYDLLCTALHVDDSSMALNDGLYTKDYEEASYSTFGYYTKQSFIAFAIMAGIKKELANATIDNMLAAAAQVPGLIERSFLSDPAKQQYLHLFQERLQRLQIA
jgi:serine/threonine-protein kinase HipA